MKKVFVKNQLCLKRISMNGKQTKLALETLRKARVLRSWSKIICPSYVCSFSPSPGTLQKLKHKWIAPFTKKCNSSWIMEETKRWATWSIAVHSLEPHSYDRTLAFPPLAADKHPSLLLSSVISMSAFWWIIHLRNLSEWLWRCVYRPVGQTVVIFKIFVSHTRRKKLLITGTFNVLSF